MKFFNIFDHFNNETDLDDDRNELDSWSSICPSPFKNNLTAKGSCVVCGTGIPRTRGFGEMIMVCDGYNCNLVVLYRFN